MIESTISAAEDGYGELELDLPRSQRLIAITSAGGAELTSMAIASGCAGGVGRANTRARSVGRSASATHDYEWLSSECMQVCRHERSPLEHWW